MAKLSGLGLTLSIDDSGGTLRAVTNDVTSVTWKTSSGEQDITGLDKSAKERLILQGDGQISITGVFNAAASTGIHTVLKDYRTIFAGQVGRTVTLGGVSGLGLSMEILFTDYSINRSPTGELIVTATGNLSDGTVPTYS